MSKRKATKVRNPVAKHNFNRPSVMPDKTKYNRRKQKENDRRIS